MIINANNLVQEFNQADMDAVVQAYPLGELQYRTLFPLMFSPSLTFGNLESTGSAKVMADIVAIGSKAPRKGREFIEEIKGEIPKMEIARDQDERDLLKIQQLRQSVSLYPNNAGIKNQLINRIYEDQPFCIDGVNARIEWAAKQLASTGKFKTTVANNSGGVANVEIDFKVPSANAAKDWFAAADADPVAEIKARQMAARALGYSFAIGVMELDTVDKVLNNINTRAFVFGVPMNSSTVLPNVTLDQLNNALVASGLPRIVVWESYVAAEVKAGTKTSTTGWVQGNILFSVDAQLGNTQYTTTLEFNMDFADTTAKSIKDDFILVKTFGHQDPILVSTKATAFAMPVLNNTKRNLILKTKLA